MFSARKLLPRIAMGLGSTSFFNQKTAYANAKQPEIEHPRLQPPKNLTEVVPSRRNPCFGFGIVIGIPQFKEHHAMLKDIQEEVINEIKPEHKAPDFIKVKSLHAAFFGNAPFTTPAGYAQFFTDPEKLNNGLFLDNLEIELGHYLHEREPRLIPVSLELNRNDGSIMARFAFLDN